MFRYKNEINLTLIQPKLGVLAKVCFAYMIVGGNLKKRLTTKNIQENEAISNCKIE